ncbi:uncharacterized protein E5676_scaffold1738G00430 [Cucumis melo var. makuwa]|uniref:Senescence-specific cysteine protease sag39 n=1 Tax=Cucumis melo var. makuwa TaxID=1194695 RepID=A0A5D3BWD7_CUCMM|nr:uncharacterized protein E5676_scaffold1738G00430 [Cucumis melo var. makuwa]
MSATNQLGKAHADELVELEEQMLYLVEVIDSIYLLESLLEIKKKFLRKQIQLMRCEHMRVNLIMRAMENQAPVEGVIPVSRIKIPEPKPFCVAKDAKTIKNFIFDLEQYFKATSIETEEAKVTLATMHLFEDAKFWWRSRYVDI